jgi:enoyl-CoA hydratase/carnithine racemase
VQPLLATLAREEPMAYETLLTDLAQGILTITLNRPQVLNAINHQLRQELGQAIDLARDDDNVKVVVIRGAGRAFSSGDDLKEAFTKPVSAYTVAKSRAGVQSEVELNFKIWDLPKTVIAQVHGHCLGAGCDLAFACDITIAGEDALFGEPEVRHISAPPTLLMPWSVGLKKTKYLLLTGQTIGAEVAERWGLVSIVVPSAELDETVRKVATDVARIPADTIALNKTAINRTYEIMGLREAVQYNVETSTLIQLTKSKEELESRQRIIREVGLKAFLEQRDKPFEDA